MKTFTFSKVELQQADAPIPPRISGTVIAHRNTRATVWMPGYQV